MYAKTLLLFLLLPQALSLGCDDAPAETDDLVQMQIPEEDPGPPFYARVTPIFNEFFYDGDWLAIPFYRDPDCIPSDFNLLDFYHFPSEMGAGAFDCPLLVEGIAYTEPDAPPNTFPKRVTMEGLGAVPVWFVPRSRIEPAIADNMLTLPELVALEPLRGAATSFDEELQPRADDHKIVITSSGNLADGRSFRFDLVHEGNTIEHIVISFGD